MELMCRHPKPLRSCCHTRYSVDPGRYNLAYARADTNQIGLRSLFKIDDMSRTPAERDALRQALASFRPAWDYASADTFGTVALIPVAEFEHPRRAFDHGLFSTQRPNVRWRRHRSGRARASDDRQPRGRRRHADARSVAISAGAFGRAVALLSCQVS